MNQPNTLKRRLAMKKLHTSFPVLPCSLLVLLLSGCGVGNFDQVVKPSSPVTFVGSSFKGNVHGGQQPVAGVAIQLYAAGSGGYGAPATPLLPAGSVLTDANGNFNFSTGSYTCPSGASLLYLTGIGGQPIAAVPPAPPVSNPNLAEMAALGPCSGVSDSTFVNMNEMTTVASVWALQQFMAGPANVSTSASNMTGLVNAFAAITSVVNTGTGTLPGPRLPAGAVLPGAEINTLADIIAQCVNSSGGSASASGSDGSTCGTLFYNAPNAAGTAYPTETITAALNIAQNPGRNVTALYNLPAATAPFQPTLTTAPAAWTIAIGYKPTGLRQPGVLAADQTGNIWIADQNTTSLVILDNSGTALSGATGYAANLLNMSNDIAIDPSGYGWMIAKANNTILRVDGSGNVTTITGGGLNSPKALAIDGQGDVWVTGGGNVISGFSASGTALSQQGFTGGGAAAGTIAIQSH